MRTILGTIRDRVQYILHRRGEIVINQRTEVLLEEPDDGERHPRRHQRITTRIHVAAILDRLNNRRIRRRTTNAQVLHLLHQARLSVASRRSGRVAISLDVRSSQALPLSQDRQPLFRVVGYIAAVGSAGYLHVGLQEAGEGDGAARRGEDAIAAIRGLARHEHLHRRALRVGHLRRDRPLPNQLVELEFLRVQLATQLARSGKGLTSRANSLVSLLRVLHLAGILTRGTRHILRPIELPGLRASSIDARLRQCRRIRAHIRNMAVLVQTLRYAHRPLRGVVQFPAGLLLERRRHKWRIRTSRIRFLFNRPY